MSEFLTNNVDNDDNGNDDNDDVIRPLSSPISSPLSSLAASVINDNQHVKVSFANNDNDNDNDLECGICYGNFFSDKDSDLKLGCGCLIHLKCLVRYMKSKIEDKESILGILRTHKQAVTNASIPGSNSDNIINDINDIGNSQFNRNHITRSESITDNDDLEVLCCPFYISKQCKYKETLLGQLDPDDKYFITLKDLSFIIDLQSHSKLETLTVDGISPRFSPRSADSNSPRSNGSPRSTRGVSEEEVTLTEEIIEKLQSWILDDKPVVIDTEQNEKFTIATTKPCPNCNFRSTHIHGHMCHHISPSGGCVNCKTEYCYKCLCTAEENRKERRSSSNCKCGGWSNFCISDESILQFIVVDPYPHDSRCGCIICPDCAYGKNCKLCNRDCVVCRGIVNPAPYELGTIYVPKSTRFTVQLKVKLILPLIRQNNFDEVIKLLDDKDIFDIDGEDNNNKNLMHYACAEGGGSEKFIKLLIERGADINRKLPASGVAASGTILLKAIYENWVTAVKVLLSIDNIDINAVDVDGTSALMWACSYGRFVADIIAMPNLQINHKSSRGNTALIAACQSNNSDTVEQILSVPGIDINIINNSGETALMFCRNSVILQKLISREELNVNVQNEKGNTILINSIEENLQDCVNLLLDHKQINVNIINTAGEFALFTSCENGRVSTVARLLAIDPSLVNTQVNDGNTCLIRACFHGYDEVVRQLLAVPDIDFLIQSGLGNTAFLIAIREKRFSCIQLLLEVPNMFKSLHILNKANESCIYHCVEKDNFELLRKLIDQILLEDDNENKFDINTRTLSTGDTALMKSCFKGHSKCTKMLLDVPNIDVNIQSNEGVTALMLAADNNRIECLDLLLKLPHLNCNLQSSSGSTSLIKACSKNYKDCVKLLLEREDIDVNLRDNEGYSALLRAANNNSSQCLLLLLQHPKIDINVKTAKGDSVLMIALRVDNGFTLTRLLSLPIDYKIQNELGESALYWACSIGNIACVKTLLSFEDIDCNVCSNSNVTPLMKACEGGFIEIIDILLARPEIQVNIKSNKGSTALMFAAISRVRGNYDSSKIKCVKKLLAFPGIEVNTKDNENNTALILATKFRLLDMVETLLDVPGIECAGDVFNDERLLIQAVEEANLNLMEKLLRLPDIDVNIQDEDDKATALITATVKGRKDCVELLLTVPNIQVNIRNQYNTTALMLAAREGEIEILNLLLASPGVELNLTNEDGKCALFRACEGDEKREGRIKCVERLLELDEIDLNIQNNDGFSCLMTAMNTNNPEIVSILLKDHKRRSSLNINLVDAEGDSALHIAGYNGDLQSLKLLLEQPDINVNILNNDGQTPLIGCAERGNLECVRALLKDPKVNIDIVDNNNYSALTRAANEDQSQTVHLLLDHNAKISSEQVVEYSILHLLCSVGAHATILRLLDTLGTMDINVRDDDDNTPLMKAIHRDSNSDHEKVVQILLAREGVDANASRLSTTTPTAIHRAAEANKIGILSLLLKINGIDVNFQNTEGTTALMLASYYGYQECITLLIQHPRINMNVISNRGNTALHIATRERKLNAIEILIGHSDVDLNLLNNEGDTPLSTAARNGSTDILKLLLSKQSIDLNVADNEGQNALVKALKSGRSDCAKLLLNHSGCNVTGETINQHKILLYMAREGDHESLKMMLKIENVDVFLTAVNGNTPLHESITRGKIECTKVLLDHVISNPINTAANFINHKSGTGTTILMLAAKAGDEKTLSTLLDLREIDINVVNNDNHSALTFSILESHHTCFELLLQRTEISLDVKIDGKNIVMYAASRGNYACIKRIIRMRPEYWNSVLNEVDSDGNTALMIAATNGQKECLKVLLDNKCDAALKNNSGETALSLAASNDKYQCVEILIGQIHWEDAIESMNKNILLALLAESGDHEKFSKVIKMGNVNINSADSKGMTALHRAAMNGHTSIVRTILENKDINVHAQDSKGITPLMLAIMSQSSQECINLLLTNSNWCCKNCHTNTQSAVYRCDICSVVYCEPCMNVNALPPAVMVSNHPHILKATKTGGWNCDGRHLDGGCKSERSVSLDHNSVRYRCDLCDFDYCERCLDAYAVSSEDAVLALNMNNIKDLRNHPHHLACCNSNPINLETTSTYTFIGQSIPYPRGSTCLHIAAILNDVDTMKMLLSIDGINVNTKDSEGDGALNLAAVGGNLDCLNLLLGSPIIDVNIRNKYGTTALMLACREGHNEIVAKLLEFPTINIHIKNEQGNTAVHRCAEKCFFECIRLLCEKSLGTKLLEEVNNKGQNALDIVLDLPDNEDCVELLIQYMTMIDSSSSDRSFQIFDNHIRDNDMVPDERDIVSDAEDDDEDDDDDDDDDDEDEEDDEDDEDDRDYA